MQLTFFLATSAAVCVAVQNFSIPNVAAVFLDSPAPFKVNVDPKFIEDTRSRVEIARAPESIDAVGDGPSLDNFTAIRDYWVNEYDWKKTEAAINLKLKQFTTIVQVPDDNSTISVPLHFVHHRSSRDDAIPLLFVHGWPGSFLEVSRIIDQLTNPPNASLPAFHVVAPSIPGFGFSPAPRHVGFGPVRAAKTFNALMQQLKYSKYVMQAGDFGGIILRYQANMFPENVVSALSNFWIIQPGYDDIRRLTQGEASREEVSYINSITNCINNESGYRFMQETHPLTVAFAMTDSPLGNALWMYSLMANSIDPSDFAWTLDEIITWSLMYFIQGPYASMRLYKEMVNDKAFAGFGFGDLPQVTQPVAISQSPHDLGYGLPIDWARRGGNVKTAFIHKQGGHFAAYEVPGLLLDDIWRWFSDTKNAGTSIFKQ